ncbi:hypothetical protein Goarm_017508 [Gossypium armourianum]|nr:hypothetical protein [Gossypium armourianum]
MPITTILAETFRSLNVECVQLLLAWFHSHFWKVEKVSDRVFCENYSPLKEFVTTQGEKTFLKKTGWQFTRVSKTKTMNEVPLG